MLPNLKRLMIINHNGYDEHIKRLILANAANLEFLSAKDLEMKFDREVRFKKVSELHCLNVDDDMIKSFPAIKRLTMRKDMTFALLNSLPAEQMLSVNMTIGTDRTVDKEQMDADLIESAAVISRMSNLKELCVSGNLSPSPNRGVDLCHALVSMFETLHVLEKVSIGINHDHNEGHVNSIITSLVQENANLRDVRFANIYLTAAAYVSLAQLNNLSNITLEMADNIRGENPTDAAITLLRGSSRNVIRKLKISNVFADVNMLTREVELIAQERGMTFEVKERQEFRVYKIHS